MKKRIYLSSLGCAKNQVDAELMLGSATAQGHTIVEDENEADVLVVNTCAFIEEARETSIEETLRLAGIKARSEGRRLIVTGCMAQRYAAELKQSIPEIDAMVGTGALDRFGEALESRDGKAFIGDKHYLPSADMDRVVLDSDGSAYLKVSEGCDHECSFCVIPMIRGKHQSRPLDDVVREAERLVASGVIELNLIAQDLSAYGRDQGERDGLASLLYRLGRVPGLERVRCHYLYPNTLSDGALEAMAVVENVCAYVDMPLQHADAGVLQRMRRGKDADSLRRILDRVRSHFDDPVLRSTFIVGFPGESETAFENLMSFVEEQGFDYLGVFGYSPEEGSAAAGMSERVDIETVQRRRDHLLAAQEEISCRRQARHVGHRMPVLVCDRDEAGIWFGRTEGQAPEVDGVTYLGRVAGLEALRGRCLPARITASDIHDLYAELDVGRASL